MAEHMSPDWLDDEMQFWSGNSPELHALMSEVEEDIVAALLRQEMPISETEMIRVGAAFIMGGLGNG